MLEEALDSVEESLDSVEEIRKVTLIRLAFYQQTFIQHRGKNLKPMNFQVRDLVFRKMILYITNPFDESSNQIGKSLMLSPPPVGLEPIIWNI